MSEECKCEQVTKYNKAINALKEIMTLRFHEEDYEGNRIWLSESKIAMDTLEELGEI